VRRPGDRATGESTVQRIGKNVLNTRGTQPDRPTTGRGTFTDRRSMKVWGSRVIPGPRRKGQGAKDRGEEKKCDSTETVMEEEKAEVLIHRKKGDQGLGSYVQRRTSPPSKVARRRFSYWREEGELDPLGGRGRTRVSELSYFKKVRRPDAVYDLGRERKRALTGNSARPEGRKEEGLLPPNAGGKSAHLSSV